MAVTAGFLETRQFFMCEHLMGGPVWLLIGVEMIPRGAALPLIPSSSRSWFRRCRRLKYSLVAEVVARF